MTLRGTRVNGVGVLRPVMDPSGEGASRAQPKSR